MDFMNLNQSAHGDREFGFIETRMGLVRKTVVGHWTRAGRARRAIGAWTRAAAGWREAHSFSVARFGDNMRQVAVTEGDKVEAQIRLGVTVDGLRRRRPRRDAVHAVSDAEVDRLVGEYEAAYDARPGASRGRRAARVAPRRGAHRGRAARTSSSGAAFSAFTDTFEDLRGAEAASRDRGPAADGRRLRLRRARATGRQLPSSGCRR